MLAVWSQRQLDPQRLRRLLVGGCAGAAMLAIGGYGATRVVSAPAPQKEEEQEKVVDVMLEDAPPDKPHEEEVPSVDENPAPAAAAPRPAPLVQQVQKLPEQTNAAKKQYDDDDHKPNFDTPGGTEGGSGSGGGGGVARVAPKPPPPKPVEAPPPEKTAAPKISPADYDPPKCKKRGIDSARAKVLNVEGKVIVTYTVTASGAVVNVSANNGPPELQPLAIAAVQAWQCAPARLKSDGSAMQVTKKVPLTVRLQ